MGVSSRDLAILALLLVLALARPLAAPPIILHGEAREGLVVQDIVVRGRWILPVRNGALPSKPPCYHWIAAIGARAFGLSDVTVRLPSALAAGVMTVATFMVGGALAGRRGAWLGVGALWGMGSFWMAAGQARVDMMFSACITTALAAFLLWYRDGGRWARALCYLGTVLAVLTKGPAGAVLVGLVLFAFLASERQARRLRDLWSWPLTGASLVVAVGWYAAAAYVGGREFLTIQILHENLDRFVGHGEFAPHRWRTPFRMELAFAGHLLPWSLALVWYARRWLAGEQTDAATRFLHVWWIVTLAFFTVAAGKRGIYLLPLYPAVALLAARALAALPPRVAVTRIALAVAVFDVTLIALTQAARERREERESLVEFAHRVGELVPAGVALRAAGLPVTDVWVLAYRLGRPIAHARLRCNARELYFVPAERAEGHTRLVVSSRRRGGNVALVRCEPSGQPGEEVEQRGVEPYRLTQIDDVPGALDDDQAGAGESGRERP